MEMRTRIYSIPARNGYGMGQTRLLRPSRAKLLNFYSYFRCGKKEAHLAVWTFGWEKKVKIPSETFG